MEANHDYVEKLDKLISDYNDSPDQELLYSILNLVFKGIAENYAVSCPVKMNMDNLTCEPLVASGKDGKDYLVIFTQENTIGDPTIAALKFQGLMYFIASNDDCKGIIFNPYGDHRLLIPKELFKNAFNAAWNIADEIQKQNDDEQQRDSSIDDLSGYGGIDCRRPIEYSLFEKIENRIRNLTDDPDDFFIVDLEADKDDLLFVQTKRHDELWYVELGYDMSEFDQIYPLILGAELELEEAVDLFRLLLAHGVSPDDMKIVQERFRDIGFTGSDEVENE